MTACQTFAQSLSEPPPASSYPTTPFSLPPSYHDEISDLPAYNRSFLSKIKCCVDRLSWLRNSGQQPILASEGLSAYDPKATLRSVAGSNDGLQFPDCLGLLPFSMESQSGSG